MSVLMTEPFMQFFDDSGNPLTGGKIFTYATNTTNNQATFTDSTGDHQNTNPVILDAAGRASIWLGTSAYTFAQQIVTGKHLAAL